MHDQPETRYARSGKLSIGYQVLGNGPVDLVFVPGTMSNIDLVWTLPASARFFRRLAAFSRLIMYDRRGQGVSDPADGVPTLEDDMADLSAVLDAAGSEGRAALFGYSEGGPMSALFAATYPERATALILFGTFASGASVIKRIAELGWSTYDEIEDMLEHWGEGRGVEIFGPSVATEDRARQFGAFERAAGSPAVVRARWQTAMEIDVTAVLGTLQAPTLVLHRAGDRAVPSSVGRDMAEAIPGHGDGFLITFDGPARAIHCGRSIVRQVPSLGVEVRAGLHTGECELVGDDVRGVAVHIGARVGAIAAGGEVLVSSTVKDLVVGSGIEFEDRGLHALKGVPGDWHLFAVAGENP